MFNIILKKYAEINATKMLNIDDNIITRMPNSFQITTNVVKQGKYNVTKITNTII